MTIPDLAWLEETIEDVPQNKKLYKLCCKFLWRGKLTYKEMFMLIFGLNKRKMGVKNAEAFALAHILTIYKNNNNTTPNLNG